jgi:hypothetical protein
LMYFVQLRIAPRVGPVHRKYSNLEASLLSVGTLLNKPRIYRGTSSATICCNVFRRFCVLMLGRKISAVGRDCRWNRHCFRASASLRRRSTQSGQPHLLKLIHHRYQVNGEPLMRVLSVWEQSGNRYACLG